MYLLCIYGTTSIQIREWTFYARLDHEQWLSSAFIVCPFWNFLLLSKFFNFLKIFANNWSATHSVCRRLVWAVATRVLHATCADPFPRLCHAGTPWWTCPKHTHNPPTLYYLLLYYTNWLLNYLDYTSQCLV